MDLVIARSESIVSIDNQPLVVDTSPLAVNIELVAYDCTGGTGNVEYNDRLRVLEPFGDITPYTSFVNAWMTVAAAITAMPLTLAQAKRVKIGLVDGIFNSKRQLPITTQSQTWDATDQSMIGMQAAIAAWDVAQAISNGDAGVAGNVSGANVSVVQTVPAAASGSAFVTGTVSGSFVTSITFGNSPGYTLTPITAAASVGGSASMTQQPQYTGNVSGIAPPTTTGPNIPWPPLNSTTIVNMTMKNMRALINSIQQRQSSLQSTRLSKTNVINGLTTVSAIIAYDATTGWPF